MEASELDYQRFWRPVPFIPVRYEFSADGRARTASYDVEVEGSDRTYMKHFAGRDLKTFITKGSPSSGVHPVVNVRLGSGRGIHARIMRLAYLTAAAHLGLPYDKADPRARHQWRIRFKDGDVTNCGVFNMEWVPSFGGTEKLQESFETARDHFINRPRKTARQRAEEMGYEWDESDLVAA